MCVLAVGFLPAVCVFYVFSVAVIWLLSCDRTDGWSSQDTDPLALPLSISASSFLCPSVQLFFLFVSLHSVIPVFLWRVVSDQLFLSVLSLWQKICFIFKSLKSLLVFLEGTHEKQTSG